MSGESTVDAAVARIESVYKRWTRDTTIAEMRRDWDDLLRPSAEPWPVDTLDAGGVAAEWIAAPQTNPGRIMLYLHGGGFRIGSIDSHRDLMQRLARAADARILAIDYRLAPEHPFPAALEDALAAYRWLISRGVAASSLAIAGDSAGGGLALSCLFAARAASLPLPAAIYLMSPWTDLTASGNSYVTRADRDPMHQKSMILRLAKAYLGAQGDAADPLASPLFGDLVGLPPLFVQCGGREIIFDDSAVLVERARAAGVDARLDVDAEMIHVFQMFGELPESAPALARAGAFLKTHVNDEAGKAPRHRLDP